MTDKPNIVPVSLTEIQTSKSNSNSSMMACHLKIHDFEVSFYNNVDKDILQAVLAEVGKYAR